MSKTDDSIAATAPKLQSGGSPCDWKPGDVIADGLEVRELIGQGGMGAVWRVHHREWNRELAVKMPLPALVESATARERFLREAETWIDLGVHPHIVQCWFVKDISGLPSLFLDFLTGGSLKQWLDAGHIRPGMWERILEISIQVAEGLAYAHSRGVVHRDVKPANLLVRGDERICVTDFGIVKTAKDDLDDEPLFAGGELPKDISITGTGAFLGTPQYGAPEQWGGAKRVDHAADIYALGVTLYEMLCGRRPFDTNEEKTPPEVLIARHLDAKPADPREFYPDVPPELAQLALRCLEKEPKNRPQDMERFKTSLSSIYSQITSRPYQGVGSVPKEQRADILNNRGVSLHSLAKPREAQDVWRLGLRIESGHPECLYNLTKLELLAGRIDGEEGLRRLRQAKAGLPLALLCIEEGAYQEAIDVLTKIEPDPSAVATGPLKRALGDAQMYAGQYYAAEKAYKQALELMPADTLSQERKRLASIGRRGVGAKILFPSLSPTFHVILTDPTIRVVVDDQSEGVVGISATHAIYWSISGQCVEERVKRPNGASAPVRVWCSEELVLCEDETSFELRSLPSLSLMGRKSGRILSVTSNLSKMVVRERTGTFVFDVSNSELQKLSFPDGAEEPRLAQFDLSGEFLCLLLQDGRVGQPDEEGVVSAEDWPERVDQSSSATAIALGSDGSCFYVGHSNGRFQSYNFVTRQLDFDLNLGEPVYEILTTTGSTRLVVKLKSAFVVLTSSGRQLLREQGTVLLDRERAQVLCFVDYRLKLYALSPFRQLRVWDEHSVPITGFSLSADGRRAVSQSGSQFDVWEVDESHRVFERSFLLNPGKTFTEIARASERFHQSFSAAHDALAREDMAACYRHLQRARSVTGYAQRPEALDLNWQLLSVLRRDHLESVWERAAIERTGSDRARPGPTVLVGEAEKIFVSFGEQYELYADDGNQTRRLWSGQGLGHLLLARLYDHEHLLVVNQKGAGYLLRMEDGQSYQAFNIDAGPLSRITYSDESLTFVTSDGDIGIFDPFQERTLGVYDGLGAGEAGVFCWRPSTPLLSVNDELFELDLKARKKSPRSFRIKGYENGSGVSYSRHSSNGTLIYLGYNDGSLLICERGRSKPVFHLYHEGGAITGFYLLSQLSVGVGSTRRGKLVFWDLHSGEVLEEFSAHKGEILSLQVSKSGRYLLTASKDEQVRLWETSWTATEEVGEPELEWITSRVSAAGKLGRFFGFGGR